MPYPVAIIKRSLSDVEISCTLLLLRWHYILLNDFSQSTMLFYLSFQFVILHLLICACTQFHHLFFLVDFVHTYHLNNVAPAALLLFIRL